MFSNEYTINTLANS